MNAAWQSKLDLIHKSFILIRFHVSTDECFRCSVQSLGDVENLIKVLNYWEVGGREWHFQGLSLLIKLHMFSTFRACVCVWFSFFFEALYLFFNSPSLIWIRCVKEIPACWWWNENRSQTLLDHHLSCNRANVATVVAMSVWGGHGVTALFRGAAGCSSKSSILVHCKLASRFAWPSNKPSFLQNMCKLFWRSFLLPKKWSYQTSNDRCLNRLWARTEIVDYQLCLPWRNKKTLSPRARPSVQRRPAVCCLATGCTSVSTPPRWSCMGKWLSLAVTLCLWSMANVAGGSVVWGLVVCNVLIAQLLRFVNRTTLMVNTPDWRLEFERSYSPYSQLTGTTAASLQKVWLPSQHLFPKVDSHMFHSSSIYFQFQQSYIY